MSLAKCFAQLKGQGGMYAAHAWRQCITLAQGVRHAASQAQKAFFAEYGLIQGVVTDGGVEADIAFLGQP